MYRRYLLNGLRSKTFYPCIVFCNACKWTICTCFLRKMSCFIHSQSSKCCCWKLGNKHVRPTFQKWHILFQIKLRQNCELDEVLSIPCSLSENQKILIEGDLQVDHPSQCLRHSFMKLYFPNRTTLGKLSRIFKSME